jgi:hypothetical protein
VLVGFVLASMASACGDTIRPAAATINGEQISQETLDAELKAIAGNADYVGTVEQGGFEVRGEGRGTLSNVFVGRVLTRQIFLRLIHDEFVRKGLKLDDGDLDLARGQVVQSSGGEAVFKRFPKDYQQTLLRRTAEVAKLQEALGGEGLTDADVRAAYDENPAEYSSTCVSHILLGVTGPDGQLDQQATGQAIDQLTSDAAAVRAQIVAGADFAAIAAERSVDTTNKDKGGDLGCGGPGRFVPEFEEAMEALALNEVSEPVPTQFGVHLIKVTDRKPQSFEEAEPQIRERLQGEGQQKFSDFLEAAVAKAKISVNPRYGRFSKDPQAPGVVPPDAPTTTAPGGPPPGAQRQPIPLQP